MKLSEIQRAYFVGIGGIGMSAIARYFNHLQIEVSGYDIQETTLTKKLVEEGISIHYHEDVKLIPKDIDIVIYTPAVPATHAALIYFKEQGRHLYKRSEVLGLICQQAETIAVAGTHGKTSTSTLLTFLAQACALNPTAFLGGISKNLDANFLIGNECIIVEADEYDRSFLRLFPHIGAITSMDADHLDIYGDHLSMKKAFAEFASQIKRGGFLILREDVRKAFAKEDLEKCKAKQIKILEYGDSGKDASFDLVKHDQWEQTYKATVLGKEIKWTWEIPGRHNAENACLVFLILALLEVDLTLASKKISEYKGVKRRFELVAKSEEKALIDDYAHHPEELSAAIDTVKEMYAEKKITGIFQPHLYSRTKDHYKAFAQELSRLDEVYILPIYPARELPMEGVTSEMIIQEMEHKEAWSVSHNELETILKEKNKEVVITLGAGNLDRHHPMIKQQMFA